MQQKVRKISLRVKILLPSIIIIIMICAALSIISYFNAKKEFIKLGADNALVAANSAAEMIDVDLLQRAISSGADSDDFDSVVVSMKKI